MPGNHPQRLAPGIADLPDPPADRARLVSVHRAPLRSPASGPPMLWRPNTPVRVRRVRAGRSTISWVAAIGPSGGRLWTSNDPARSHPSGSIRALLRLLRPDTRGRGDHLQRCVSQCGVGGSCTPFGVRCFGTARAFEDNPWLWRFLYALWREVLRNRMTTRYGRQSTLLLYALWREVLRNPTPARDPLTSICGWPLHARPPGPQRVIDTRAS